MQYSLNYSGTKFLSPKIKITEFSGEFLLNAWNFTSGSMMNDHTRSPIDFCFRGILRGAIAIVALQSDTLSTLLGGATVLIFFACYGSKALNSKCHPLPIIMATSPE